MPEAPSTTKPALAALATILLATAAWADEYTVVPLPGGPVAPTGTVSAVIGTGQDDVTQTVDLPFAFPYFGRLHDRISICTNGWAALVATTASVASNPPLPSTAAPNGVLAPLWDDLVTGSGSVSTFTNGTAPGRVFVVEWSDVASFDGASSGLRFQVALHEGGGAVEFAYGTGGTFSGMSYTAGIEDPTGTVAFAAAGTGNDLSARPSGVVRFEPRITVVDGVLLRDRPVADASGLGNTTESGLPVIGATVRLVRDDTGDVAAVGITSDDGSFELRGSGFVGTETLAVDVAAEGLAGRVIDASTVVYAHRVADSLDADAVVHVGTVTLDAAVDAVSPAFRRALNIHQALDRGHRVATAAAAWGAAALPGDPADTIPPLDATWVPGVGTGEGSSYTPSGGGAPGAMTVADGVANPDAYDDDVVLREYGHHVLASLSVHPGPAPALRDFAAATTSAYAWADGFAYFFAAAVQGRDVFIDTVSSDTAVVDDLETPPPGARGELFPAAVAGSLWDLVDPANESEDEADGTLGPAPSTFVDVLATVDRLLDTIPAGTPEITVRTFFDVWRGGGSPEEVLDRQRAARVFIHHGTLPDDDAEPNDRIDEATPTAGPGSKITGLQLSPANVDVFALVIPDPVPQTVEIALQQTTSVDLRLALLDPAGQTLVDTTNEGVGGAGRQTLRLQPIAPLTPGTHHVRVESAAAATGAYSLSIFRPLLLTTGDLPEWTAGVSFKVDLVAAGGVEPYTFDTTTDAPGLTVSEDGSRVSGVPGDAGTFDVTVVVTDSAEPATAVTSVRPLLVNPHPVLPLLFGVAAHRDGAWVLGTGGTVTEWTPLVQPPNALALVGGADLRLVGDSGAPTAFALSADALDSVGARLDGASTFVVVTADLLAGGGDVPLDPAFGWYVDALAGSDIDVTLHFRGEGETPLVSGVVDDAGASLLTDGLVQSSGRKVKVRGVRARETGRAHILFTRNDFEGRVEIQAKVRPVRRVIGQSAITSAADVVEVPVDVLAGARVRIDLRRLPSPTSLEPTVVEVVDPDGRSLALPTERRRGRKRAILRFTADQDGRYLLRFAGAPDTTGPLFYKVRIDTPRSARLVLD